MMMKSLRSWLGLDRPDTPESAPLRELVDALEHLPEERAQYLARFAYLLGRVAHADRIVTPEETQAMERLVAAEGDLTPDQAMLVVSLARNSNRLFGSTADFLVVREFGETASYEQKLALVRCLFKVSATDGRIGVDEEAEIHRIANQLRILPEDLTALRLAHRSHLPGLGGRGSTGSR